MKTYKNLFAEILCYENLLAAAHQAAKSIRSNPAVMAFFERLEDNLFDLQIQLQAQNYCPGDYTTFHIYDPKPRLISAAPFRDRVVHHALMNIVAPLLERSYFFSTLMLIAEERAPIGRSDSTKIIFENLILC